MTSFFIILPIIWWQSRWLYPNLWFHVEFQEGTIAFPKDLPVIILSYDSGFVEKRGVQYTRIPQLHPDLWPLFTGLSFWGNIRENLMVPYLMALFQPLVFCHHAAGGWRLSLELTHTETCDSVELLLAHIWLWINACNPFTSYFGFHQEGFDPSSRYCANLGDQDRGLLTDPLGARRRCVGCEGRPAPWTIMRSFSQRANNTAPLFSWKDDIMIYHLWSSWSLLIVDEVSTFIWFVVLFFHMF
jgi:hypothetical protein